MSLIEKRIKELGYELPEANAPLFEYVPIVVHNGVAYLSGQVPKVKGELKVVGKVGDTVTLEQAQEGSRICILNLLASLKQAIGSLDKVERILKVTGFVNSAPGFTSQPSVIDGGSKLLGEIFGEKGRHARSAVGADLPRDVSVEIEMIVAVER